MGLKEMEKELRKLTQQELIRFCIEEFGRRYCDGFDLLKFKIEQMLKRVKEEKKNQLDKKCFEAYEEMIEAQKKCITTQEYLDLEAKLKKLQTEPYTKTCYKDILNHNKEIGKIIDKLITLKKPLATARRKYLDLCKKRWELNEC